MKALKECGVDVHLCHYNVTPYGERRWMVDDEVIADFGKGFTAKLWKRVYYSPIIEYARREGIGLVYIRSYHNANPFTLRLAKRLKRTGAKVVMEIPTYPYDQEYVTRSMKLGLAVDRFSVGAWRRDWTASSLFPMRRLSSAGARYVYPTG